MIDTIKQPKDPGRFIKADIVQKWIRSESDAENKALLQELLDVDDNDPSAVAKAIDDVLRTGIKTEREILSILLPESTPLIVGESAQISEAGVLQALESSPTVQIAIALSAVPYFPLNSFAFKLREYSKRVPDHFLRWAFRECEFIRNADTSQNKEVSTSVLLDWVRRIPADDARAVLMLDHRTIQGYGLDVELALVKRVSSHGAAEILVSQHTNPDPLSKETRRALFEMIAEDDKEFLRMFGGAPYEGV